MRRRTALLVLSAAASVEVFSLWRFHLAEAHRWSVLAALAAIAIVGAVLGIVLSVALGDPESDVPS